MMMNITHGDQPLHQKDWRGRIWILNYTKRPLGHNNWEINWEIIAPDGSTKASLTNDIELGRRCVNVDGLFDREHLHYEFKWLVNHYSNEVDIKKLRAEQMMRNLILESSDPLAPATEESVPSKRKAKAS
jgi:hypothetical protein